MSLNQPTVIFPGFDGGAEWGGPAVDPSTGVLYVNSTEMAGVGRLALATEVGSPGQRVYRSQCAMCHGGNRAGAPPEFPSLVDISSRLTVAQVIDTVQHGKGRMPSFPNIDESAMNALIDFLRAGPPRSQHPNPIPGLDSIPSLGAPPAPAIDAAGATVYQRRCAKCHGDRRQGNPPAMSAAQTVNLLHNGKGVMPPMPEVQGPELDSLLGYLGVAPKPRNTS